MGRSQIEVLVRCLKRTTFAKSIPDRSLANSIVIGTWIASTHTKDFGSDLKNKFDVDPRLRS
jgi:hypothetical protein